MTELSILHRLGVSLGLGLLVGIQRQHQASTLAGIRTFPLISMLGTLAMHLDGGVPSWLTATGLLTVAGMLYTGNLAKLRAGHVDPGLTTEIAALLVYAVGAAAGAGQLSPAIAVGGAVTVLLHWKQPLHQIVATIGDEDLRAVMQFVLIALVILPVLPNQSYGPLEVLNPFKIWLMVVLIVGISLTAYLAAKIFGPRAGAVIGGCLGGLISSTATTVSYARQTRHGGISPGSAALVIMIASTMVLGRMLIEVAVVSRPLFAAMVGQVGVLATVMLGLSLLLVPWAPRDIKPIEHRNPTQLKTAVVFGGLYAVVLVLVAAIKSSTDDRALYGVAVVSGLTDLDAITLSTAELFQQRQLPQATAWRLIFVAFMSNLVFKCGTVAILGPRALAVRVSVMFGIALGVSAAVVAFWP